MNVQRAEVLMVDFPFHEGTGSKIRPAVVTMDVSFPHSVIF